MKLESNLSTSPDTKSDDFVSCQNLTLNIPQHLFSLEKISPTEIDESELLGHEKLDALNRILSSEKWRGHQLLAEKLGQDRYTPSEHIVLRSIMS